MRIYLSSFAVALLSSASQAFVPMPTRQASSLPKNMELYARYSPPLPPPPPPPPPAVEPSILDGLIEKVNSFELQAPTTETLGALKEQVALLDQSVLQQIDELSTQIQTKLSDIVPTALTEEIQTHLAPLLQSEALTGLVSAMAAYALTTTVLTWGAPAAPSVPYPSGRYDIYGARAYFDRRPLQVVSRGLEIMTQSLQFALKLLQDRNGGPDERRDLERGKELAELLTRLGPTFIKVGQSLSIRTDLLSPAYIRGLETLQDRVPAFDTNVARQIMEEEWGTRVENVIESLPSEPIAAASLGQVYKCRLKSGEEVAIKVQRPNIKEQIALDMFLLREMAPIIKRIGNLNTDTVGTVDAWGSGFVDELDYLQEARNAKFFTDKIKDSSLKDVVFSPTVVEEYSTGAVLMTEWVDGERLDSSSKEDVSALCSIAMNTYLTMLLDFGLLHCDPHPGNLLRTPDGRLAILDWGMVTCINSELQLTLVEHMAHLTSADYAEIPRDLLLLDFIPQDKAHLIEDSGVVEVLAEIYGQWTAGGGAASINVNEVVNQLQDLTAKKGNLFQIPPYFAYIAKSFSVLEGIGLSNDPQYSIINGCLPYISQRLLTDNERMGPALSTFIFGPNKSRDDRIIEYRRVEQLVEGFGEYATSSSGALLGKGETSRSEQVEAVADQILSIIFTEEETPVQTIFIEQLAKIVSSSSRSFFTQVRERSGVLPSGRTVLGTVLDPLGFWRTSPLVRPNDLDERTVETTRKLLALAQRQIEKSDNPMVDLNTLSRQEAFDLVSILVRKVWAKRSGVLQTSSRFARKLLELTAQNLERGERDTRLPPSPRPPLETTNVASSGNDAKLLPSTPESPRLQAARQRLASLQNANLD